MNICKICNQEFRYLKFLSLHVKKHNITTEKYYNLYLKKNNLDGICPQCKNKSNFLGLRGYTKYCSLKCSCNSEENKQLRKFTYLLKYGVDHPSKTEEFQNKKKQTCLKIYGVDHQSKSEKIKEKKKQTNLINMGVDNPFKSEEIKKQIRQTNLKKFGCEYPSQSEEVKEKYIITLLKHYNVKNASQIEEIKEKKKLTSIKNYGYDSWTKTPQGKRKLRENMIQLIMSNYKDGSKFLPTEGIQERLCFDELQVFSSYHFLKNQTFIGYFPDRYIKELNLIIEFYENWHKSLWCLKHDIVRKAELIEELKCNFFIIEEIDWKNNKQYVIENFIFITKQLELDYELRKTQTDFN